MRESLASLKSVLPPRLMENLLQIMSSEPSIVLCKLYAPGVHSEGWLGEGAAAAGRAGNKDAAVDFRLSQIPWQRRPTRPFLVARLCRLGLMGILVSRALAASLTHPRSPLRLIQPRSCPG